MEKFIERNLSGWAQYPRSTGRTYRPEKVQGIADILHDREEHSYIGRGMGRSYGDAALNEGGGLILTQRIQRLLAFDPGTGVLTCEAGVMLERILQVLVPQGWFLPVTPGTKFVTIAGAVACDVHGKNHHTDGSLSKFVVSLDLLLADGRFLNCSRDKNSDLFWATLGGMGLTGMILAVTLRLRRIDSAFIQVDYRSTRDLDETMRLLEDQDRQHTYSVAWVDGLASGRHLGRSVLIHGDHAGLQDLSSQQRTTPLDFGHRRCWSVPFQFPGFVLNRLSVGAFNGLYYRRFRGSHSSAIVDYDRFFYPLDSVHKWYRMYGKHGFVQYQCVIPFETSSAALVEILEHLKRDGIPSYLVVLKRFGEETGLISFPKPGYTLAMDMPVSGSQLFSSLGKLDRCVLNHGGRVYLGKDACLSAESFREMYPDYREWLNLKREFDPENVFSSDLSRRLRIGGARG